jgi:serine/threonine-protein kinase HipA
MNAPRVNELFLWWLADPAQPCLLGTLKAVSRTAAGPGGVSFEYDARWLKRPGAIALSEDLPLGVGTYMPPAEGDAPGAIDDARPDRWGERIIQRFDNPPRLGTLEFLYFAGDARFGGLGVSSSRDTYAPRPISPVPLVDHLELLREVADKVESGTPIDERLKRLLAPGVSMGGARPKALMRMDGHEWIVKFSAQGDDVDVPLVEHATMTLARQAGIDVCETRAMPLRTGHAVAIRRFDREGGQPDKRLHALSARTALRAAGQSFGYPELALLLRRRGDAMAIERNGERVFRRMVFNILMDNTDDHEKNHALLLRGHDLALSPAYDVVPTGQALGYQSFRVGKDGHASTMANALSETRAFSMSANRAQALAREVAQVVAGWRTHFEQCGVKQQDIQTILTQIDGPLLRAERDGLLGL